MKNKKRRYNIDETFDILLSRNNPLERLIDTGLFFDKETIESKISEPLDDWHTYSQNINSDKQECFDYWVLSLYPVLIIHAVRYLEFTYKKQSLSFRRDKHSFLTGDLSAIEKIRHIDDYDLPIVELIKLCWLPIKATENYNTKSSLWIVEIITNISDDISTQKLANFEEREKYHDKQLQLDARKRQILEDENRKLRNILVDKATSGKNEVDNKHTEKELKQPIKKKTPIHEQRLKKLIDWVSQQNNFNPFNHDMTQEQVWDSCIKEYISKSVRRTFFQKHAVKIIRFSSGRPKNLPK